MPPLLRPKKHTAYHRTLQYLANGRCTTYITKGDHEMHFSAPAIDMLRNFQTFSTPFKYISCYLCLQDDSPGCGLIQCKSLAFPAPLLLERSFQSRFLELGKVRQPHRQSIMLQYHVKRYEVSKPLKMINWCLRVT